MVNPPMGISVPGLKLENGVLYSYDPVKKEWGEAPLSLIPTLQELLKKLENVKYPEITKREHLVLEDQYDVGTGKVKTFKDVDGDMQVMFETGASMEAEFDEDAAFGLTNKREPETEPKNYWGTSKITEASYSIRSDVQDGRSDFLEVPLLKKKRLRTDISSVAPPVINIPEHSSCDSSLLSEKDEFTPFKKRKVASSSNLKTVYFTLRKMLLGDGSTVIEEERRKSSIFDRPIVSFISGRHKNMKADEMIGVLIGTLRYNCKKKIPGVFESNFYLRVKADARYRVFNRK